MMLPSPYPSQQEDRSAPPNRRSWPPPPYSADGRRPRPDDDESGARILRSIGVSSIVLGVVLGLAALAGTMYLNRGEYRPEDVLVLLAVCAAGVCCVPSLITGVVLSVAAAVQACRERRNAAGNGNDDPTLTDDFVAAEASREGPSCV
ncbi:hypothetical protein JS533_000015 [Bifidobacterium amazonense]|uniref:Uncharacterized protein n=1 Tax=Bifidobacterium amazonense TaxID=2809027 RepID=A0ABS9VR98_9BIFI|nr:hypothetical protein [Bifidobacterium amazonense]MCH9274679.1 hypothetical protein [Bifidobacterium amazonense]